MKNSRILFLIPLFCLLCASVAMAQEEILILDHPAAFPHKQRAAVPFPHEIHMGNLECFDCHHNYENGKNILTEDDLKEGNTDLDCMSCHDATTNLNLKQAFHRQCMGCHRKLRIARETTGPELCGECHVRKRNPGTAGALKEMPR